MRQFSLCAVLFLCCVFSANAQDLIILKDGNVIEARVTEISPSEIRYKRYAHLDGPTVVIPVSRVLSIRYENGMVEIFNAVAETKTETEPEQVQENLSQEKTPTQQSGLPPLIQYAVNQLPAIPIAGRKLKFELSSDTWAAKVNGKDFLSGTLTFVDTDEGCILTLKQTHTYLRGMKIGTPGPEISLEYIKGPPSSLRLVSNSEQQEQVPSDQPAMKTANAVNNWVSFEPALFGFGVRYERMLDSNVSFGVNAYAGLNFNFWAVFDINVFFRVYPAGKTFFLGFGFGVAPGYGREYSEYSEYFYYMIEYDTGLTIVPEMGWKIDVGEVGGFYIMPCITIPIFMGDIVVPYRLFYFGMGYSF